MNFFILKRLINKFSKYLLKIVLFILIFSCYTSFADDIQQNIGLWNNLIVGGPLTEDQVFEYFVESQLRLLLDRNNIFDQTIVNGGVGYRYQPDLSFWLGNTWAIINDPIDGPDQEGRTWQQINWSIFNNNSFSLLSRTRLEERKDFDEPQLAFRLRERVTLNIPLQNLKKGYAFITFDEVFFNLNHPEWVANQTISQNRSFVGIEIPTSKRTSIDIGYLNQLLISSGFYQMNHFLYLNLNVNTG